MERFQDRNAWSHRLLQSNGITVQKLGRICIIMGKQEYKMKNRILMAILPIALAATCTFAAEGKTYIPSEKAAALLADGHPWSADAPDGKTLKITLNRDGTGSIKGPMPFTLSVKWSLVGEALCIDGKMGTRCLRFSETSAGLQGWDGNKPDLKFSR